MLRRGRPCHGCRSRRRRHRCHRQPLRAAARVARQMELYMRSVSTPVQLAGKWPGGVSRQGAAWLLQAVGVTCRPDRNQGRLPPGNARFFSSIPVHLLFLN